MAKTKEFISLLVQVLCTFGGALLAIYSMVTTFTDIPPIIQDWRIGVGLGNLVFFIGVGWIIFDLHKRYVWGSEPEIKITSKKENFNIQGYAAAWLIIKNMEQ